jgi:hypothetical protein
MRAAYDLHPREARPLQEVLHATIDKQIVKWVDWPVAVGGSRATGGGPGWTGIDRQRSTSHCANQR